MGDKQRMRQLEGKVAIITGAAGGIGAATARVLLERGARVVLADLDLAAAQAVARQLDAAGDLTLALPLDLAVESAIVSMIRAALEKFDKIDIVHNNAADLSPANAGRDHD